MADVQGFICVDDSFNSSNPDHGRGYESRDYSAYPLAGGKCARPFTRPRLTEQEIRERIKDKTANKTWLRDKADHVGSKVKNQSQSNYCWNHAVVRGMELVRIGQGGTVLTLSAFYGAAIIKGGANQGGSGITSIEWHTKHGTCREEFHPPMDFSTRNTPEAIANAELHQITLYEDLDASDLLAIYTEVCDDVPVSVGIPAWGHEVCITFLVEENGEILPGIDNSWGTSWGTNGRGVLRGRMKRFDEAGAIVSIEQSVA